jgi:hypothetical protein
VTVKKLIKALTPPLFIYSVGYVKKTLVGLRYRHWLGKNAMLKNLHTGERCFILGNGPSVKEQNLSYLKEEIVFSVSNGYKHTAYAEIRPKYHVVPQITFGAVTEQNVIDWFFEMDDEIVSEILFLSTQQYELIERTNGFKERNIRYVCMQGDFDGALKLPSLEWCIPAVHSAPILAIMIAMYMGFKDVYLLGVDHDWFFKRNYSYAFGKTMFSGKDIGVGAEGEMLDMRLADQLPIAAALWRQYRFLHNIADKNDIHIYNATYGGALDEFERVDFERLMVESRGF